VDYICPCNVLFECNKCGLCCGDTKEKSRHILLLESEATLISTETCLTTPDFTEKITGKDPYSYEMKKTLGGKCLFLKNNQCRIYGLRPLICRFYPFELKFNPAKDQHVFNFTVECPGISKGKRMTVKDFEALFLIARERLL
jgi:Fe-S-cluster containining protein